MKMGGRGSDVIIVPFGQNIRKGFLYDGSAWLAVQKEPLGRVTGGLLLDGC